MKTLNGVIFTIYKRISQYHKASFDGKSLSAGIKSQFIFPWHSYYVIDSHVSPLFVIGFLTKCPFKCALDVIGMFVIDFLFAS